MNYLSLSFEGYIKIKYMMYALNFSKIIYDEKNNLYYLY